MISGSDATAQRLAWLDALRGIGAMAVVAEHMLPWLMPALRPYWFNLGMYGVLVFFLVSGYIIPASLERKGDVSTFWISRIFRLYPLYLLVIGLVLVMGIWVPVRPHVPRDVTAVAAHLTMLSDVHHMAAVADPMWTLSYEMVFYLLVTALFLRGAHRASGSISIAFGIAAVVLGVVLTGPLLPDRWPALVTCAIFVAGIACLITGRFRTVAGYTLGLMALVLLVFGSYVPWFAAAILSVMFAGTAIYRWEQGTGSLVPVAVSLGLVALAPVQAVQAGWWWVQPRVWTTTIALAAGTFALAMALRGRRLPRVLPWLGLISYSVYLIHQPMLRWLQAALGDLRLLPTEQRAALMAGYLALLLSVSWLTYRYLEAPAQRFGRRLARRRRVAAEPAAA
ncbi:acyltransferase [Thermobispora bispora]|uniref:Acyltransferase 3 n=2 Tax=Thermobispora bispora TaxID=2006 RepID=D6Y5L0_THEBD|nr:acyltransferase 3 [Thermobispora bispora DSM 43833]MBO2475594.1 acyltransferase [Actinomycetales bacterium]MBX6167784.1 acyltransferase [Thermobispora bispora]MDI9582057.1 acyltransferase [Thermobispora sp.]QSI49642.1 acyltransferase [Thermobispora bispora]